MARKTWIRRVSRKRKQQNDDYLELRREFLEENPVCQVCRSDNSSEVHHQRGKEGRWLTETAEFLAVCRDCHEFIEQNRDWAARTGYLKLRLTKDQIENL